MVSGLEEPFASSSFDHLPCPLQSRPEGDPSLPLRSKQKFHQELRGAGGLEICIPGTETKVSLGSGSVSSSRVTPVPLGPPHPLTGAGLALSRQGHAGELPFWL